MFRRKHSGEWKHAVVHEVRLRSRRTTPDYRLGVQLGENRDKFDIDFVPLQGSAPRTLSGMGVGVGSPSISLRRSPRDFPSTQPVGMCIAFSRKDESAISGITFGDEWGRRFEPTLTRMGYSADRARLWDADRTQTMGAVLHAPFEPFLPLMKNLQFDRPGALRGLRLSLRLAGIHSSHPNAARVQAGYRTLGPPNFTWPFRIP